ncbi:protein GAMETE EXPRESSED 2 [Aristolochia californica]|uniref:protein GAMETE EXPRESSED 2 n=1 Tax=Aristolochia californica TaxID=171875 RepID=UPI0035D9D55A
MGTLGGNASIYQHSGLVQEVDRLLTCWTQSGKADNRPTSPDFIVSWYNDRRDFKAGDVATIKISFLESSENYRNLPTDGYHDRFTIAVGGRTGNSSFISGVSAVAEADFTNWNMTFVPIIVGKFQVTIKDYYTGISDQSLHFNVRPGDIYPAVCFASWRNLESEFEAGRKARALVLAKDAFGNNISSTSDDISSFKFMAVYATYVNGSILSELQVTYIGWDEFGYIAVEFLAATAGPFFLHLEGKNQTLNGSPLPFKVTPGPLDITNCSAVWNYGINVLQIFSNLEVFIYQKDRFGNLVDGSYAFDALVTEEATNLSVPLTDLQLEVAGTGVQLLSFSVSEPGEFVLTVFDDKQDGSTTNMRYEYTVFVGYCHGLNSIVNGSALQGSVAGGTSHFSIYLQDIYHNPAPISLQWIRVQIIRRNDSLEVPPNIVPIDEIGKPVLEPIQQHSGNAGGITASPVTNAISNFNVEFLPVKSGLYDVWVFCGNIPLNGGHPYTSVVFPASVNTSISSVVKFSKKVTRLVRNVIVLQLADKFSNPVMSQQRKLAFDFRSPNSSEFVSWMFEDNGDGSYLGYYLVNNTGTCEICVSFEGNTLPPCPLEINVYRQEYFPQAFNDTISVWENESVAFDVLRNDYFADGDISVIEESMPSYGSLLRYGQLFRYTPYQGFFGSDSFSYTLRDVNQNLAAGTVIISVFISPPRFVSLPSQLEATEDMICPRFSGFCGFEIQYSDPKENISVTLSAPFGTILLAPMPMQFWKPEQDGLSATRGKTGKDMILAGCVEVINSALQLVQYLGNENFYGNDVINLSTKNKYGTESANVPIVVEPINDPPFIQVPEYIILERKGSNVSLKIFDEQKPATEFLIGDPDLFYFSGNKSLFIVTISVEASSGVLTTTLPVHLINTTEVMLQNSYQWQPLQTFVTISNHFVIKGEGFRFRGTIEECNNAMQQLLYEGTDNGAALYVTVNDMGNFGCYSNCTKRMSLPVLTEATIHLVQKRPMSSLVSKLLGSAIIIGFLTMLLLGVMLLLFICKCATALGYKKRTPIQKEVQLSDADSFQKPAESSATSSENATYFTGCSTPFLLRAHRSNFRQRSSRRCELGESSKVESRSLRDYVTTGEPLAS